MEQNPIANSLLKRMTLEEKCAQLGGVMPGLFLNENFTKIDETKLAALVNEGIGHISRLPSTIGEKPSQVAEMANQIQKFLVEKTRLGIPAILHEEAAAGVMGANLPLFPMPIALACSFDPELAWKIGDVSRKEMRAMGVHNALAPVLDVARDARWGRCEETFGECPYLIAQMGTAFIAGIQGDTMEHGVTATGKHFVAHGCSEGGRNWGPVSVGERELREVYLYPFAEAIGQGLKCVMNAYHERDGVPAGSDEHLLRKILRDELGFSGVIESDYWTLNNLESYHKVTENTVQTAVAALKAGIDVELPTLKYYSGRKGENDEQKKGKDGKKEKKDQAEEGGNLGDAVRNGSIDISYVDQAVFRVLKQKEDLGLFKYPYVDIKHVQENYDEEYSKPQIKLLAYECARKSIVLLQNKDSILPLKLQETSGSPVKIAIIGRHAYETRLTLGDYQYPAHLEGFPSPVTHRQIPIPSIYEEIAKVTGESKKYLIITKTRNGPSINPRISEEDNIEIENSYNIAKEADVVILFVGDRSGLSDECTTGESRDRADVRLVKTVRKLTNRILKLKDKKIILVLVSGKALAIEKESTQTNAIIHAFIPGQEGARAIAEILFGKLNPSGKLSISIPRIPGSHPVHYNHKPSGLRSNWHGDYVDGKCDALYSFGFGLSYAEFKLSDFSIWNTQLSIEQPSRKHFNISLTIENVSSIHGAEIVQVYCSFKPGTGLTHPVLQLVEMRRVELSPKQQERILLQVPLTLLKYCDNHLKYALHPCKLSLHVGNSSDPSTFAASFDVELVSNSVVSKL